jgi:hypothetical protein
VIADEPAERVAGDGALVGAAVAAIQLGAPGRAGGGVGEWRQGRLASGPGFDAEGRGELDVGAGRGRIEARWDVAQSVGAAGASGFARAGGRGRATPGLLEEIREGRVYEVGIDGAGQPGRIGVRVVDGCEPLPDERFRFLRDPRRARGAEQRGGRPFILEIRGLVGTHRVVEGEARAVGLLGFGAEVEVDGGEEELDVVRVPLQTLAEG